MTTHTPNMMTWPETAQSAVVAFSQLIAQAASFLVVTHVNPDGDAIGSLLGMVALLQAMGKQADAVVDDGVPEYLRFLPGADQIRKHAGKGQWDVMISLDASDEARTGEAGTAGRKHCQRVVNIDHHPTNTLFGDLQLVIPQAVSTTEVIWEWSRMAGLGLSPEAATALLCGLVTDTLGFRTSNVTAHTLAIGQHLMQAGASLTEITERTLDSRDFQVISLWKNALNSVELYEGGVLVGIVTQEQMKQAGLLETTDGGLIQFLIRVNQAMIAAILKETPEGTIDLSMRSKPGFDVSEIAFSLGGGGHKQAAGAKLAGPPEEAKKHLLPLLIQAARQGKLTIG